MSNDELVQSSLSYRSWQGMTGDWTLGSYGISKCQSILRWQVCSRIVRAINHARKKKAEGQRCVLCFFSNQSPEIIRVSSVNQSLVRPRLSERWIALATRQISIRWTVQNVLASDLFVGQRYLPFEQLGPDEKKIKPTNLH